MNNSNKWNITYSKKRIRAKKWIIMVMPNSVFYRKIDCNNFWCLRNKEMIWSIEKSGQSRSLHRRKSTFHWSSRALRLRSVSSWVRVYRRQARQQLASAKRLSRLQLCLKHKLLYWLACQLLMNWASRQQNQLSTFFCLKSRRML